MPYLARRARFAGLPLVLLLFIAGISSSPLGAAAGRWSPLGPEGGTVAAVVFAPSDPRVVYAGLWGGGVFRSADGGVTWTAPSGRMAGQSVFSLAVDPENPAVAYAGTGDGVWKTASGGAAWTAFPGRLPGVPVLHLAVDPSNRQTVYAGAQKGFFRSADGGRTWGSASQGLPAVNPREGQGEVTALAIDPGPPVRLFAAVLRQNGLTELFASTDRGATWTRVNGPGSAGIYQVSGFVWDRTSHTLYLNAWPPLNQPGAPSLWKSSDGGATWSKLALPGRLAFNGVRLAVDSSGVLYAGSYGVWKSTDGGVTWSEVGAIDAGGTVRVFGFVFSLAADPGRAGRLLAGTFDFGIFESTGGAWRAVNRGLTGAEALALEISPGSGKVLYAALVGQGVLQSLDGGAHWVPRNQGLELEGAYFPYHIVTSLAFDPTPPSRLYAGLFRGVARSTDGGAHWSLSIISECATAHVLAVDPESDTVYAAADGASDCLLPCSFRVSRDAGRTWSCRSGVGRATAALVDPINTAVVYVASDSLRGLFKSTDRGASFVPIGPADQDVRALAISPAAHRVVYAGTVRGVFKSVDAGRHWSLTGLPGVFVSALAVDPQDVRRVYAGAPGRGVFQSLDGGGTWTPLNDGLPTAAFYGPLRLDPRSPRTLYAGTYGSGFWKITLP